MSSFLNAFLSQTAQDGGQAAQPGQGSQGVGSLFDSMRSGWGLLIFIGILFYFVLIRPQGRQQKDHRLFLQSLKKGDEIVTNSGIIGRVVQVEDRSVTLDVGGGNKMRVIKSQLATAWVERPGQADATKAEAKK